MKICLLGSQGTGKTTLVNLYKREHFIIIDNVARKVIAAGGKSNENGDVKTQQQIFDDYANALTTDKYLSTRSVIDVLAYTMYLKQHSKVNILDLRSIYNYIRLLIEIRREYNAVQQWLKNNPDVVICYVPVEFEPEQDGVRSTDKKYQSEIDDIMKKLFTALIKKDLIKYGYVIHGSLKRRKEQLDCIILSE